MVRLTPLAALRRGGGGEVLYQVTVAPELLTPIGCGQRLNDKQSK